MTTEIAQAKPQDLAATTTEARTFELIQRAVDAGTPPEVLEKIVALQERIIAKNAETEFNVAMNQFQKECPVVVKTKEVRDRGGRLLYRYAPLEDIVLQIRDLLAKLGLSFAFSEETGEDGALTEYCIIRHIAGHREKTPAFTPSTKGINTNASQDKGIQRTYGRRSAFTGALGIVTADEDQDGQVQALRPVTEQQAAELRSLAEDVGADAGKFLAYMKAEDFSAIPQRDYERAVAALEAKRAHIVTALRNLAE